MLKLLQHRRVIRVITAVVKESLDPQTTTIGVQTKVLMAQIFVTIAQSKSVQRLVDAIASHVEVDPSDIDTAIDYAQEADPIASAAIHFATDDKTRKSLFVVAHSAAWSPVRSIDERVVSLCRDTGVASAAMVEVVVWVSVLQMLRRLSVFYEDELVALESTLTTQP